MGKHPRTIKRIYELGAQDNCMAISPYEYSHCSQHHRSIVPYRLQWSRSRRHTHRQRAWYHSSHHSSSVKTRASYYELPARRRRPRPIILFSWCRNDLQAFHKDKRLLPYHLPDVIGQTSRVYRLWGAEGKRATAVKFHVSTTIVSSCMCSVWGKLRAKYVFRFHGVYVCTLVPPSWSDWCTVLYLILP